MPNQAYPCPVCGWVMPVVSIGPGDNGGLVVTHVCLREHQEQDQLSRTGKSFEIFMAKSS